MGQNSFILTHNRDEHHTRSVALMPQHDHIQSTEVIYPKDEQGGGTWFATSKNFTLCLLNGGTRKHTQVPPYKHSRGLVILDFFRWNDVEQFKEFYEFDGLEPFTLLVIDHEKHQIHQFIKDVDAVLYETKDANETHIWSSTTLYNEEDRLKRREWFSRWVREQTSYSQDAILAFHKQKFDDEQQEGILINRDSILFTVSLTSVLKLSDQPVQLIYEDFIRSKNCSIELQG